MLQRFNVGAEEGITLGWRTMETVEELAATEAEETATLDAAGGVRPETTKSCGVQANKTSREAAAISSLAFLMGKKGEEIRPIG